MLLKDNKLFTLPRLTGGSFSGMDRLYIPHNILILKEVKQREDNGRITLICQAKDGPEEISGGVRFTMADRGKIDILYQWLLQQVGKDIETIYRTEFNFGSENYMKQCPKCGSALFESMEPKIATLANVHSKFPNQSNYWRCSNGDCDYREKI